MIAKKSGIKDLDQAVRLEKLCFKEPWSPADCQREMEENPFSQFWLLKEENQVIGYAFIWKIFEDADIARIGVDPNFRNKGLAQNFLEKIFAALKEEETEFVRLEVRAGNTPALALYKKLGFIEVNRIPHYYPDGEDAINMTCAL